METMLTRGLWSAEMALAVFTLGWLAWALLTDKDHF